MYKKYLATYLFAMVSLSYTMNPIGDKELFDAINYGKPEEVQRLLTSKNINAINEKTNQTPLIAAISTSPGRNKEKYYRIIDLLLAHKDIDVNKKAGDNSPFLVALHKVHPDVTVIEKLKNKGARIDLEALLAESVWKNNQELGNLALRYGAKPNKQLLRIAMINVNPDVVKWLVPKLTIDQDDLEHVLSIYNYEKKVNELNTSAAFLPEDPEQKLAHLKEIGRILLNALKLTTGKGLISKEGLAGPYGSNLPPAIKQYINTFLPAE